MDRLISEQAVIDRLSNWYSDMLETGKEHEDLIEVIKAIPSAEPKTGHWKMMYKPENMVVCSECGKCAYLYNGRTSTWCPHCGNYKGEQE